MDPNELIYIVAQIKPAPGKVPEVLAGLAELAAAVEANEPGCISYQYFHNEKDDEVAVFEIYKDFAAVEAHKNSAHYAEAMSEKNKDLQAAPPRIQLVKRKGGFRR